jgi:hypothetical protein
LLASPIVLKTTGTDMILRMDWLMETEERSYNSVLRIEVEVDMQAKE